MFIQGVGKANPSIIAGIVHAMELTSALREDLSHKLLSIVNKRGGGEGEAKKLFDEMDVDGNGMMSTKEFSDALAKLNLVVSKRALSNLLRSTSEPGRKAFHFDDFCALLFCERQDVKSDLDDPTYSGIAAAPSSSSRGSNGEEKTHHSSVSIGMCVASHDRDCTRR